MTKTSPASAAIQQGDHNSSNACSKKQCILPLPSAHTPAHIFHKNNTRLLMLLLLLDTAIVVGAPASST
jgi:hypothetical protein